MALINKLENIAAAIREKTGKSDLLTLEQMPVEIAAIETGGGSAELPEEAFTLTDDCSNRFSNGGWDWFLENYGKKIVTKDLISISYMFNGSKIEEIPFELNFHSNPLMISSSAFQYAFSNVVNLKSLPKINWNNARILALTSFIANCDNLREIQEGLFEGADFNNLHTATSANMNYLFKYCYSLRRIAPSVLSQLYTAGNRALNQIYSNLGYNNYALDELIDVPVATAPTVTSNMFTYTVEDAYRLKDFMFKTNEDGTPQIAKWKSQTIDFSQNVGCFNYSTSGWNESSIKSGITSSEITRYNSGITDDKAIYDETTYAALKNDPDAFCMNYTGNKYHYSRYNHDSAVNTINSLPDTSAYLATAGGTNTIKFAGASGSATDGGAINTLTEEEIAVATAKGWTVTLV